MPVVRSRPGSIVHRHPVVDRHRTTARSRTAPGVVHVAPLIVPVFPWPVAIDQRRARALVEVVGRHQAQVRVVDRHADAGGGRQIARGIARPRRQGVGPAVGDTCRRPARCCTARWCLPRPVGAPLRRNCTPTTPTLSLALALTVTIAEDRRTVAPVPSSRLAARVGSGGGGVATLNVMIEIVRVRVARRILTPHVPRVAGAVHQAGQHGAVTRASGGRERIGLTRIRDVPATSRTGTSHSHWSSGSVVCVVPAGSAPVGCAIGPHRRRCIGADRGVHVCEDLGC